MALITCLTLSIAYNITNKQLLNALPLPWTVGTGQLAIGGAWAACLWSLRLRERPKLAVHDVATLAPVAFFHGAGQLATVLSLGAGAVSFTHIVKAMEPFFSAMVSAAVFSQVFPLRVYLALIPVVGGVAMACYTGLTFSWRSFLFASASNLLFACRANFSKALMKGRGTVAEMSAPNLYACVTLCAFALCAPIALIFEGSGMVSTWRSAAANLAQQHSGDAGKRLATLAVLSGLFHYSNNEVMYMALDSVDPVTLAVGNTMKRVFIIVASVIFFSEDITLMSAFGSFVGIAGVLLYSLAKNGL